MKIASVDVASKFHTVLVKGSTSVVSNQPKALLHWLGSLEQGTVIVMEATGGYGMPLAELAYEAGFEVYVLPPRQVAAFRKAVGFRAKTDRKDAELIFEFARLHLEGMHRFVPLAEPWRSLKALVKERWALAADRDRLAKRTRGRVEQPELLEAFRTAMERLDERIKETVCGLDKGKELMELPGVGPMLAGMALAVFADKAFRHKDAFVAYSGLDLQVVDSGEKRGTRRLTRRGDKTLRCLLFMAGFSASRSREYRDRYAALRNEKKLKPTQAQIVLARTLARRIYGIMRT